MTDVRWLNNGLTYGGNLNTHLGGLRHLEYPVLRVFLEIPKYPCDLPMDRHPGSKGTEMIHARNFRVQPQAIMGSSIVE